MQRIELSFYSLLSRLMACVAIAGLAIGHIAQAAAPPSYILGVVPQYTKFVQVKIWQPIITSLAEKTGASIELAQEASFDAFEERCLRAGFDIVYLNPYQMRTLSQRGLYQPLVTDAGSSLRGILVVRSDSALRNPQELDGRTVAFPSPYAFAASMVLRADLSNKFSAHVVEKYMQNHSSVYRYVAMGLVDAGGGAVSTLGKEGAEIKDKLRVIYTTADLPSHAIAVRRALPEAAKKRILDALLQLGKNESGRQWLQAIPINEIRAASDKDYAGIDAMRLKDIYQGKIR